jgi:hypothetical protein
MAMTDSCPRCGALVTYFASDIGETTTCRNCGDILRVTTDGLVRTHTSAHAAAPSQAAPAAPMPPAPSPSPMPASAPDAGARSSVGDLLGMVLGILFLPGLIITVVFLLLPIIGRGRLSAIEADQIELDVPVTKARQELEQKKTEKRDEIRKNERDVQAKLDDIPDRQKELDARRDKLFAKAQAEGKQPDKADIDAIDREREKLRQEQDSLQREREKYQDQKRKLEADTSKELRGEVEKLEQAQRENAKKRGPLELERSALEANLLRWNYRFQWGQLVGVLVLLVGSVGYLSNRHSVVRRVVGAIAIGAVVLLIVAKMNNGRGVFLTMGNAAGGDKGLSAYNLSTPRDALVADMHMLLNNDVHAYAEFRGFGDQLRQIREKRDTIKVHKEAKWKEQVLLFVSFQMDDRMTHTVEAMERVPGKGRWRPRMISPDQVKGSDPALAKEMEHWNKGSP